MPSACKEIIKASGLPADRVEALLELKQEEQLRELVDTVNKTW